MAAVKVFAVNILWNIKRIKGNLLEFFVVCKKTNKIKRGCNKARNENFKQLVLFAVNEITYLI